MRAAAIEAVLGALLMSAGVIGPAAGPSPDGLANAEDVAARAALGEVNYTGEARLEASEAGLRLTGPLQATVELDEVTVTVYDYVEHRATARTPTGGGVTVGAKSEYDVERERYEDARVRLDGRASSRLHAWPNETLGPSSFALSLERTPLGSLSPSTDSADMHVAWWFLEREFDAPVFGLADGDELDDSRGSPALEPAGFSRLEASGGLDLVVQNASFVVDHADGRERYETRTDRQRHAGGVAGKAGATEGVATTHRRIALLSVDDPSGFGLDLEQDRGEPGVEELAGVFVAHRPRLHVDGGVAFHAREGSLQVGNDSRRTDGASDGAPIGGGREARSLDGSDVRLLGNLRLDLRAEGEDEDLPLPRPLDDHSRPRETVADPLVHAEVEGQAREVRVDGQALAAGEGGAVSGQAGWLAQLLGALLLAWTVAKQVGPPILGQFVSNPLENETRREIYEHLQDHGLAYLRELARIFELNTSTAEYHMHLLERAGMVTSVERSGYRVFFVPGGTFEPSETERLALLADPTRREIARLVGRREVSTQTGLADRVGIHQSTVSRHLSAMVEEGLVKRYGVRDSVYDPTELLTRWIEECHPSQE